MQKQIKVISKTEKNGVTSDNRPWTLTTLVDADNVKFSTFKGENYKVGEVYEIEYTEKQNGKWTNRNIVEPKAGGQKFAKPIATQNQEKALELLKEILKYVKDSNEILQVMAPNANPKDDIKNNPF